MVVHAYIMCYNEEALIEFTLRHYSKFCSRIFLLDNMSTDRSLEIARGFDAVTILRWSSGGKMNTRMHVDWKSNVYKWYSRKGGDRTREVADWVIACDMDELIYHPQMMQLLEQAKADQATVIPTQGYNMCGAALPQSGGAITSKIRNGSRVTLYDKTALFACDFDIYYSAGCHPTEESQKELESRAGYKQGSDKVLLLHYNNIGDRLIQVARKNRDRLSQENIDNNYGYHYRLDEDFIRGTSTHLAGRAEPVLSEDGDILVDL